MYENENYFNSLDSPYVIYINVGYYRFIIIVVYDNVIYLVHVEEIQLIYFNLICYHYSIKLYNIINEPVLLLAAAILQCKVLHDIRRAITLVPPPMSKATVTVMWLNLKLCVSIQSVNNKTNKPLPLAAAVAAAAALKSNRKSQKTKIPCTV